MDTLVAGVLFSAIYATIFRSPWVETSREVAFMTVFMQERVCVSVSGSSKNFFFLAILQKPRCPRLQVRPDDSKPLVLWMRLSGAGS